MRRSSLVLLTCVDQRDRGDRCPPRSGGIEVPPKGGGGPRGSARGAIVHLFQPLAGAARSTVSPALVRWIRPTVAAGAEGTVSDTGDAPWADLNRGERSDLAAMVSLLP